MIKSLKRFIADETGATAIEYGLIAALLSVAVIAALLNVSGQLQTVYSEISTALK
jgi:pilus assembly protein Flp/PilA